MSSTLDMCPRLKPIVQACSVRCVAATVTVFVRIIAVSVPVRSMTVCIPAIYAKARYEERSFANPGGDLSQFCSPTIDLPARYAGEFLF
ncbi:MAG: hypothetical protein SFV17_03210 [Candidatus Obscuribacter sp.]|nr:hypothetical protein [Candidatus Obscuribacter sp.]